MTTRIILPRVRLSFANVFSKGEYQGETSDKFECTGLLPKDSSDALVDRLKEISNELLEAKYGAKIPAEFKKWLDGPMFGVTDKLFIRDGENFSYDGYADHWAIKASSKPQPKLLDSDKSVLTESSGKLYSGSYANMLIDLWVQDNKFGKRINANLLALQHIAHGEAFSAGGVIPEDVVDEFDELEGEAMSTDF